MERVKINGQNFEKININDKVSFRLTSFGRKVYKDYIERTYPAGKVGGINLRKETLKQIRPKENGMSELQLWQIVAIFGKEIDRTDSNQIFKKNELFLQRRNDF